MPSITQLLNGGSQTQTGLEPLPSDLSTLLATGIRGFPLGVTAEPERKRDRTVEPDDENW